VFNKFIFAALVAMAAVAGPSQAFAQTLEFFGPSMPMQFDRFGARHFYRYGYYGPFAPPMPSPVAKATRDRPEHRSHMSSTATQPKAGFVRSGLVG
jgi:hypothetical protein